MICIVAEDNYWILLHCIKLDFSLMDKDNNKMRIVHTYIIVCQKLKILWCVLFCVFKTKWAVKWSFALLDLDKSKDSKALEINLLIGPEISSYFSNKFWLFTQAKHIKMDLVTKQWTYSLPYHLYNIESWKLEFLEIIFPN